MDIARTLIHDSPLIAICFSVLTFANLPGAFRDAKLILAHLCFWTANTLTVELGLIDHPTYAFATALFMASAFCSLVYSRYPRLLPLKATHIIGHLWGAVLLFASIAHPSQTGWSVVGLLLIGVVLATSRSGRILVRSE